MVMEKDMDEEIALGRSEQMPQGAHCTHYLWARSPGSRGLSQKYQFLPETVAS